MSTPIPILLYHSIAQDASPKFLPWVVPQNQFAQQMQSLADQGYTPITVSGLVQRMGNTSGSFPERPVVISFDDGFVDFLTGAVPILDRYKFPATLYVVTAAVGGTSQWLAEEGEGDRPCLSWDQIAELPGQGIEIGAHSHTHPQLDTLPLSAANEEIRLSKSLLEDHLGQPVDSFAYPHGYHSPAVRRLVQQAGFSSACGVKHAMSALNDDPFSLARIIIRRDLSLEGFGQLIEGRFLRTAPQGERLQTIVWRGIRRSMVHFHRPKPAHRIGSQEN
jgi:peptidoglycan/xylan/chitin deacetylase (PgdA/CDA1 family)